MNHLFIILYALMGYASSLPCDTGASFQCPSEVSGRTLYPDPLNPCASYFFACPPGHSAVCMNCPIGLNGAYLVFNPTEQYCDYPINVGSCQDQTSAPPTSKTNMSTKEASRNPNSPKTTVNTQSTGHHNPTGPQPTGPHPNGSHPTDNHHPTGHHHPTGPHPTGPRPTGSPHPTDHHDPTEHHHPTAPHPTGHAPSACTPHGYNGPRIPLYQMYGHFDHFYTCSAYEVEYAKTHFGYKPLGTVGSLVPHQPSQDPQCDNLQPLYRLYKKEHYYTTSSIAKNWAEKVLGYTYEGISGYCASERTYGTTKTLFEFFNGFDHLYLTNPHEKPFGYFFVTVTCHIWDSV